MSKQVQYSLSSEVKLAVNYGSVTEFGYPANPDKAVIVNSANNICLGGGGIDGAIGAAGGENLYNDRCALPVLRHHDNPYRARRCATGTCVMTGPNDYGRLNTKYVIHAVSPNYAHDKYLNNEDLADCKLQNAYKNSLKCASAAGLESIAFSLISMGKFRGNNRSIHDLLRIAIRAILDVHHFTQPLKEIHLCGYSEEEYLAIIEVAYGEGLVRVSG